MIKNFRSPDSDQLGQYNIARNSFGIVLFDVSRKSTFENLEDIFNEFYWAYRNNETRLLYLVGNKCDKERREVSFEEAKELAD